LNQIRKRLTYANVMSSIAVFLILGGATAVAAGQLGKNTVGSKQLKKNAVTAAKIKANAVTVAKLKNNAVTSPKIADNSVTTTKLAPNSVTGAKVQASSLGTVPSATNATNATNAQNLAGQQSFFIRLNPGQTQTIASNGSVSLVATCESTGGKDTVKIIGQTTISGAILNGGLFGPGENEFLEPGTEESKRVLLSHADTTGDISVSRQIDNGYILGPDLKMITTNSEGIALGLNYGGTTCLTAGLVNLISG